MRQINRQLLTAGPRTFLAVAATAISLAGGQAASAAPTAFRPGPAAAAPAAASRTLLENGPGRYPRAIQLQHNGSANGRIIASVTSFSAGDGIGLIYQSTDGGQTFQ